MLQELYPNAYSRYPALPLLGPVLDDFDSWLLAQGYRWNTRQPYIHQTTRIDNYLRKRGRHNLSEHPEPTKNRIPVYSAFLRLPG